MKILRDKEESFDNPDTYLGLCPSDGNKVGNTASKQRNRSRKIPDLNWNLPKEPADGEQNGIQGLSGTYDTNGVTKILILVVVKLMLQKYGLALN